MRRNLECHLIEVLFGLYDQGRLQVARFIEVQSALLRLEKDDAVFFLCKRNLGKSDSHAIDYSDDRVSRRNGVRRTAREVLYRVGDVCSLIFGRLREPRAHFLMQL